jgi:phosphocarrier protein
MSTQTELHLVLANKKGLHARAAAKFVKVVAQFDTKIIVAKIAGAGVVQGAPPIESSGGSILGLMMLGAEYGSTLRLSLDGAQAVEAAEELKKLVESRFGED